MNMNNRSPWKLMAGLWLVLGVLLAVAPVGAEPITAPFTPGTLTMTPGFFMPPATEGSGFVSQTFIVPEGGTTISFHVNLLTHEPDPIPPGTCCNDYLAYTLFGGFGNPIVGPYMPGVTVSVMPTAGIPLPFPVFGPHGEEYLFQSGVFTASLVVPGDFSGVPSRLGIAVFDLDDTVVDTGAIIDNIVYPGSGGDFSGGPGPYFSPDGGYVGSFHSLTVGGPDDFSPFGVDMTGFLGGYVHISTGPGPLEVVPEPASLLLLGSGLAGLAAWRRRSRKD